MSDLLTSITSTPEDEKSFHVAKTVCKSATDVTVKRVAVEKHMAHNKSLRMQSAEMKTAWILPFASPPQKIAFRWKNTKKSIGKAYNRVNLYLCSNSDYEGIKLSCLFSLGLVLAFTSKFLSSYQTTKSGLVSS